MKRLIIALLLFASTAWAGEPITLSRMNPYVLGSSVPAACTPSSIIDTNAVATAFVTTTIRSMSFPLAAAKDIYYIYTQCSCSAADASVYRLTLSNDSSGTPCGSNIATIDVACSVIGSTTTDYKWEFSAKQSLSAGTYWITIANVSGTAEFSWSYVAEDSATYKYMFGGCPSPTEFDAYFDFNIFGCDP